MVAAVGLVILPLVYLVAVQTGFSHHHQLPVAPVLLAWALATVSGLAYQYWVESAEKRKVKRIFSRYVSPDIYQQLLDNPAAAALGGSRRQMTVLFSDLRGFTTFSEGRAPEEVIDQLNEYFAAMVEVVFAHRGTVDKFVGDMIMALFSAPLDDPEHADHALECAVTMQRRLVELNAVWRAQGRPELACGVGINSGEMVAGNLGSEKIQSYTVIGDNVNLGARIESLCKEFDATILISEFTHALLRGDWALEELGEVTVKGKTRPVTIYRVD
jgi:adenylate cyclase